MSTRLRCIDGPWAGEMLMLSHSQGTITMRISVRGAVWVGRYVKQLNKSMSRRKTIKYQGCYALYWRTQ